MVMVQDCKWNDSGTVCVIAAKGKRVQPPWSPPTGTDVPQLRLYNSLTRAKVGHHHPQSHSHGSPPHPRPHWLPSFLMLKLRCCRLWLTTPHLCPLVSVVSGAVCTSKREQSDVVQLRADSVRCLTHGTRQVEESVFSHTCGAFPLTFNLCAGHTSPLIYCDES